MVFLLKTSCYFAFDGQALLDLIHRFGIRWDLLGLQSINFIAMAMMLYAFAFRPVMRLMEERKKKIAAGLAQAEEAKDRLLEAEKLRQQMLKGAHNEAQQIVASARGRVQAYALEQQRIARVRADGLMEEAREVIAREKEQAFAEVRREMSEIIADLAERVLEGHMSVSEREQYVQLSKACLERKATQ
ncbi:MAG: F0F1 ATP synthase subunit B [Puniceicoccales bacterium]|jgi:F-type H+-transporting ATPase subunit b|nr:F0F1 ATP synthase subunit B [Puniceicoccales bacterium]